MAELPPGVEIAGIETVGDEVRYRLRYDVRQVLAEALQDALPSREPEMFMRQLDALERSIIDRGYTLAALAAEPVLCREEGTGPWGTFTCQRVANHGGLNHWGTDGRTGAEMSWRIKDDTITAKEAAEMLGLEPQTLRSAANQLREGAASDGALAGRLSMRRLGRDWVMPRHLVEAELARRG